ncbi:dolichyl-P-Man:Man(7)GlcNAc(2)-PP-dolichol alpha-1,6-mannosyltransferase [Lambiella insularis]|nr:dolichyl-P-Man:Man(7)GlcNAc(2)-PP-dolichol alpha-1,6-mannosyltransferase [Lambiella insularis]
MGPSLIHIGVCTGHVTNTAIMRRLTDTTIALLVPLLVLLHLYVAPYTKVEESFNIQATHDILTYGVPFKNVRSYLESCYDHFTFPGSVPRTFVGPLALAGASRPLVWLVEGVDKQILVRAILGLYNAFSILAFRNGIAKAFGRNTANWYVIFQASQFHVMYYASRTLSNFFAFGLSTLALRSVTLSIGGVQHQVGDQVYEYQKGLVLLTVVGIVFRSEIAILLGCHTVWLLLQQRLSLRNVVASGLVGLVIGLGLTVPIDSFFWQKLPLWPEFTGFMFNIMQGRSTDWGTSPFHYYFTSALPRLLLNPLAYQVCIPLALYTPALRGPVLDMLVPNLVFVAIYSFQPHKEWRFIVYVIPPLTAAAAMGASWIWTRRTKSTAYRVLALGLLGFTATSFVISLGMLAVSSLNYPGADALNYLHAHADGSKEVVKVHMDTFSCTTGVTRFLQMPAMEDSSLPARRTLWVYDKTENETQLLRPAFWDQFDYALAEMPERAIGSWEIIHTIDAFTGLKLIRPGEQSSAGFDRETSFVPFSEPEDFHRGVTRRGIYRSWLHVEEFVRNKFTRGWGIRATTEPRISVLKSIKL